jgi:hypothetical protein
LRPQHRQKLLGAELRIPLDEETLRPCAQTHIVSSFAANMATAAVQNMRNIGAIVAVAGLFALPLTAETQGTAMPVAGLPQDEADALREWCEETIGTNGKSSSTLRDLVGTMSAAGKLQPIFETPQLLGGPCHGEWGRTLCRKDGSSQCPQQSRIFGFLFPARF